MPKHATLDGPLKKLLFRVDDSTTIFSNFTNMIGIFFICYSIKTIFAFFCRQYLQSF